MDEMAQAALALREVMSTAQAAFDAMCSAQAANDKAQIAKNEAQMKFYAAQQAWMDAL